MSKQLFKEKTPVLKAVCNSCKLEIRRSGTMTSWIFKENRCNCSTKKRSHRLVVVGNSEKSEASETKSVNAQHQVTAETPSLPDVDLGPNYEVLSILGKGGMGTVYKIRDKRLDKIFAAKVLSTELTKEQLSVRRFIQEAEAASSMSHANIATIYSHEVTSNQTHFLIMEFVDGVSLDQLLAKRARGVEFAIDIFIQICDALEHAHAHGIIHRDLKPANILIAENEKGASIVKIVDFGIAKMAETAKRQTIDLTQTGELFGSPSYMSPEHCLGFECDARSDIYSLGCIMYETISGRAPFVEQNVIQTIVRHLDEPPKPLQSSIFIRTPESLNSTVMRALEKDPLVRYQSAVELRKDLELIQDGKKTKTVRKSRSQLPIYFMLIAMIDMVLLFGSFTQYSSCIEAKFKARSVISEANALSKLYYDAGVALGGYSITKSPLFSDRYEKIMQLIPEDVHELERLVANDQQAQPSMQNVKTLMTDGTSILTDAHKAIESGTMGQAQTTAKHMYQQIRQIADRLQEELKTLTASSVKISTDAQWMVKANLLFAIEVLLILLGSVALVGALVRRQEKNSRKLMWIGQRKP